MAMRLYALVAVITFLVCVSGVNAQSAQPAQAGKSMQIPNDSRAVAPALDKYAQATLTELWNRPDLSPRDRSVVTLAVMIARNQTVQMPQYISVALDHGVKPREISEIITHLAFYAGWGNAASTVAVAKEVFAARKVGSDQLPAASPQLLPLNLAAEEQRAASVKQQFGTI